MNKWRQINDYQWAFVHEDDSGKTTRFLGAVVRVPLPWFIRLFGIERYSAQIGDDNNVQLFKKFNKAKEHVESAVNG